MEEYQKELGGVSSHTRFEVKDSF
jgi:hypothetical protein